MADPKNDVAQQRRAGWVGLRTLRQRPRMVDHTAHGEPVYEVRSVRLVLRPDASHFNRLVECAKCGKEVPGAPVLDPASLEHPVNAVICKSCVQTSTIAASRQPEKVVAAVAPTPAAVKRPEPTRPARTPAPAPPPPAADDGRLATLETQLRAVVRQVRELADVDRSPSVDGAQAEERIQVQLHEAVGAEVAGLRAELAAVRDAEGPKMADLADQVRGDVAAMAEALQAQGRDLSTLVAMVEESRAEVERVGRSNADLSASQAALDQRVAALSDQVAAAPVAPVPTSPPPDVLEGFDAKVAALTQMVETHRREVAAVMQERVPPDLSPLLGAVEELSQARAQLDDRIDVLMREAAEQRARIDALLAAVDGGSRRLQEVEQRMHDDVDRLTGMLEGQRRDLQSKLESVPKPPPPPPPFLGDPDGDDLLDVLERQLMEAERRLAHRSIGARSD